MLNVIEKNFNGRQASAKMPVLEYNESSKEPNDERIKTGYVYYLNS